MVLLHQATSPGNLTLIDKKKDFHPNHKESDRSADE
jgi:hypothetical protein